MRTASKSRSRQPSKADSEHKKIKPVTPKKPAVVTPTPQRRNLFAYDPYYYPDSGSEEEEDSTAADSESDSSSDFTEDENVPLSTLVDRSARPITPGMQFTNIELSSALL